MAITNIKKELKLNKFEYTRPIHVRDLVGRTGYASMPEGSYTGDESAVRPMSKIEQLQYGYRLVQQTVEEMKSQK